MARQRAVRFFGRMLKDSAWRGAGLGGSGRHQLGARVAVDMNSSANKNSCCILSEFAKRVAPCELFPAISIRAFGVLAENRVSAGKTVVGDHFALRFHRACVADFAEGFGGVPAFVRRGDSDSRQIGCFATRRTTKNDGLPTDRLKPG